MKFSSAKAKLPSPANAFLAALSAIILILAFPDFDFWFLAWFALVPLFFAVEREKQSVVKSFVLGWIFGTLFFFGSCWWLTFAPITYGRVPTIIAYLLFSGVALVAGLFPAIFGGLFSLFLKRFGSYAILSAPFLWTATEFLRFWITGNNWNAIGYSQAFSANALKYASIGGVYLLGFLVVFCNSLIIWLYRYLKKEFGEGIFVSYVRYTLSPSAILYMAQNHDEMQKPVTEKQQLILISLVFILFLVMVVTIFIGGNYSPSKPFERLSESAFIIAIQPNVPMSGLKYGEREKLLEHHIQLAQNAIANSNFSSYAEEQANIYSNPQNFEERKRFYSDFAAENFQKAKKIIIFPESPMNFEYESDREFQSFLKDFAARNNASVLFNSAQPNTHGTNFYNSAVMINAQGGKIAQYDKIHLVPFGETVPLPDALAQVVPTLVGNFETGANYNLFPLGEAKGGVMICFESHFASLAREFVRGGADVLIEMTNDGYLGDTPILRQHLANAVFRAVETNRPVLRVTNVGITAYINERGEVLDAAKPYTEDTRVWTVLKSDGAQTFYVRYGDWFAWLCSLVSLALLFWSFRKRNLPQSAQRTQRKYLTTDEQR
jgi:apolipoprotein N-acyltransferase